MISVFTPLSASGNQYIYAAYETLKAQTIQDWEWIVLENHGGALPKNIRKDPRVKLAGDTRLQGIGALKRRCCELSSGEYLFEFDHDDLLHETALEKAMAAFDDGADFVFSDTAEFKDKTWEPNCYGAEYGWTHYPVEFQGHQLLAQPNPPVTPHNLRLIDWSPNHFRAFRKEAYLAVGGHSPELHVGDDHDLMLRFFLMGKIFKHVPECLYFYRVHAKQTTNANVGNAKIRQVTEALYDKHIFDLAEKWCLDHQLDLVGNSYKKIDLCGAIDTYKDYFPLDKSLGHDLDERWPLNDDSVGVIRAFDAIEHLKDPIHTMNEAYRVLAPGGFFLIQVPSTTGPIIRTPAMDGGEFHWVASAGRGAFQDPTHVSFWNENSFWYYTKRDLARYIPHMTARFQVSRLRTFFPSSFHAEHAIPYVEAHLIALKDGYSPMGRVEI
jgi:SAM-dependent methyltransferase